MEKPRAFETYPCPTILLSNLISFSIYAAGAFLVSRWGIIWMALYLVYVLALEVRLMKNRCVNCYYYGKFCAFGKGKLSAVFFKKGSPRAFHQGKITWKDMLPDILVSAIPIVAGITSLFFGFSWLTLSSVALLALLTSAGNGFVRGSLACKFCKQRELGCPAEQLFNQKAATSH